MTEIVINRCPRGTLLSEAGLAEYRARSGNVDATAETIARDDAALVAMMRENPGLYGGRCSHIAIIEADFPWKVMRRGTVEWIAPDA